MADITASMVRELRDRTGVAMMDCKQALQETHGDLDAAVDLLRKKGQAKQDKLASRAATEGWVAVEAANDGRSGALVELNCNTDFTAKSAPLVKLAHTAAVKLLQHPDVDLAGNVNASITEVAQQTGENIRIGRTAILKNPEGRVGVYSHYTGKVGVLVSLSGSPGDELIKDLCLHITATRPLGLSRQDVPQDVVAREREIAVDQAKATGKPQNIAEKIAEGKMNSFYEERVLLDQKFVKDPGKTITQLLKESGVELKEYVRVEVGQ
jgi:elongation factor Ts